MLAVERDVIAELVDEHPREHAHVDITPWENRGRRRRARELPLVAPLYHGPHIAKDLVGRGLLREPVRLVRRDDSIPVGVVAREFGGRDVDRHNGNRVVEAKTLVVGRLRHVGSAANMSPHRGRFRLRLYVWRLEPLAQR